MTTYLRSAPLRRAQLARFTQWSGRALLALGTALTCPAAALAQPAPLAPGEYLTEQGWGRMTIEPAAGGAQKFTIEALGANAHSCSLDGAIRGRQARLEDTGEKDRPCVVDFTPKGGGIEVMPKTEEACRAFCGMRARFDGLYLKPAPGCGGDQVQKTRAAFKRIYDKKDYAQARATLAPVLATCGKTLSFEEESWVRNDLAITYYRLGDLAECRRALDPLRELAALSAAEVRDGFPPADAELRAPIARAARANLKLCQGGAK